MYAQNILIIPLFEVFECISPQIKDSDGKKDQ